MPVLIKGAKKLDKNNLKQFDEFLSKENGKKIFNIEDFNNATKANCLNMYFLHMLAEKML